MSKFFLEKFGSKFSRNILIMQSKVHTNYLEKVVSQLNLKDFNSIKKISRLGLKKVWQIVMILVMIGRWSMT